jgi:catechol 2,3-dioxygenase-like lactoylglutathione lyase family enzyme
MTANKGQVGATAAGDILGVHSLDAFSFAVPDLAKAAAFHRAFGLVVTERGGVLEVGTEGVAGAPKRSASGLVRPSRMSHILLFTSDVDRAVRFYTRVLGLGLSDRAGSDIAFLHGRHGSDHHMIAFVKSSAPGLHHTSWDVPSVHHVGLGAMSMADKGFANGWGVGRHVLGSNYFHYVRDPWGSYAEYSCDMDYIPRDMDWAPGDHDGADAFYVWGPTPPADFGVNHEAAAR